LDRESTAAYLSGDLDPPLAQEYAAHLLQCDRCRGQVDELSRTIEQVRQALHLLDDDAYAEPPNVDLITGSTRPRQRGSNWTVPVASAAAIVGIVTAFVLRQTPVRADTLLDRVAAADARFEQLPRQVVHRSIAVERKSHDGVLKRRVEIWRDASRGIKIRRAYDGRGTLLAAEIETGGISRVYRSSHLGSPPEFSTSPRLNAEDMWRWEPSPTDFRRAVGDASVANVIEDPKAFRIEWTGGPGTQTVAVVKAVLTIDKAASHATHEVLSGRQGDEIVDYAFTETGRIQVPTAAVEPALFQADVEFGPNPSAPVAATPARSVRMDAPEDGRLALERTELRAWYGVHRLESCLTSSQIARRADRIRVDLALRTDACRPEATRAFVGFSPPLDVRITIGDPPQHPDVSDPTRVPAYQAVHEYFAQFDRTAENAVTDAAGPIARRFVVWVLDHARKLQSEFQAARAFMRAWPIERIARLDLDALASWQNIVRDHARTIRQENSALRGQLQAVFPSGSSPPTESVSTTVRTLSDVVVLTDQMGQVVDTLTNQVEQLFGDSGSVDAQPISNAELDRSFARLDQVSAAFEGPWTIERQ
jgi:hypothetical protein